MSQSAGARIWRTFGLKPHLVDTFKLSKDPQFIEKVRDVVGLYLAPPEHALVLCVDEKTQIQALDRSAPVLPMMPGMPERRTHDYVRGGVTTLRSLQRHPPARRRARQRRHRRPPPSPPRNPPTTATQAALAFPVPTPLVGLACCAVVRPPAATAQTV